MAARVSRSRSSARSRTATARHQSTPRRQSPRPQPLEQWGSIEDLEQGGALTAAAGGGTRRGSTPHSCHGARRESYPRQSRSAGQDRTPARLRAGRCRRALRARAEDGRRGPHSVRGGRKPINVLAHRSCGAARCSTPVPSASASARWPGQRSSPRSARPSRSLMAGISPPLACTLGSLRCWATDARLDRQRLVGPHHPGPALAGRSCASGRRHRPDGGEPVPKVPRTVLSVLEDDHPYTTLGGGRLRRRAQRGARGRARARRRSVPPAAVSPHLDEVFKANLSWTLEVVHAWYPAVRCIDYPGPRMTR